MHKAIIYSPFTAFIELVAQIQALLYQTRCLGVVDHVGN